MKERKFTAAAVREAVVEAFAKHARRSGGKVVVGPSFGVPIEAFAEDIAGELELEVDETPRPAGPPKSESKRSGGGSSSRTDES